MRFTDANIRALKAGKPPEGVKAHKGRYDVLESGATGLAVRVSQRGVKTFSYLYRFGGKSRRLTLGVYRDAYLLTRLTGLAHDVRGLPYITLADARVKLAEARKLRDSGVNPATAAVQAHQAERKADTVDDLIDAYCEKYAETNKKASGAAEDKRMLNKDVRPAWGDRKVSSITRQDVIDLLDEVVARGAPVAANRLLAVTRKMFRWAVRRGLIATSPVVEIDRPGGKETSRDRALTEIEIVEVWNASGKLEAPYSQLVRLLLVTGQRRGEIAGWRRSENDDRAKLWTIPRSRTKNSLDHEVPLSPLALEVLKTVPVKNDPSTKKPTDCLFVSGRVGDQPISEFKGAKKRLDDHIFVARREVLHTAGMDPAEAKPMPHWTLHDLRRTMRTGLSKLRLDPEICERAINHVPAGVRRTYDVHQYREEKREVLNAWAAHLRRLLAAKRTASSKVVKLRAATV